MLKTEDIARLSDEQLGKIMRQRQADLRKLRELARDRKGADGIGEQIKFAEEDVCYLTREQEVRVARSEAHRRWQSGRRMNYA